MRNLESVAQKMAELLHKVRKRTLPVVVVGEVKGIMITEGLHISLWSAQLVGQAIYWSIFLIPAISAIRCTILVAVKKLKKC